MSIEEGSKLPVELFIFIFAFFSLRRDGPRKGAIAIAVTVSRIASYGEAGEAGTAFAFGVART
jgi:hypothetical protein